jgi:hypothetical protein
VAAVDGHRAARSVSASRLRHFSFPDSFSTIIRSILIGIRPSFTPTAGTYLVFVFLFLYLLSRKTDSA